MGKKKEIILIEDSDDDEKMEMDIDPSYAKFIKKMEKVEEKARLKRASSEGSSKHRMDSSVGPSKNRKRMVKRGKELQQHKLQRHL